MEAAREHSHLGSWHQPRTMNLNDAADMYLKLRKCLSVVDGYGYYPPGYGKHLKRAGQVSGMRLCEPQHTSQRWVVWNPTQGRRPTFKEFLMVYRITAND